MLRLVCYAMMSNHRGLTEQKRSVLLTRTPELEEPIPPAVTFEPFSPAVLARSSRPLRGGPDLAVLSVSMRRATSPLPPWLPCLPVSDACSPHHLACGPNRIFFCRCGSVLWRGVAVSLPRGGVAVAPHGVAVLPSRRRCSFPVARRRLSPAQRSNARGRLSSAGSAGSQLRAA
jgi:hypothetical protein